MRVLCRVMLMWSLVLLQDANECWLQMVRVLQQKLEPLEPETPMEVILLSFLLSLLLNIFLSQRLQKLLMCVLVVDRVALVFPD